MRRPAAALSAVFAVSVWLSLLAAPSVYDMNRKADGRYVTMTGTVDFKEYAQKTNEEEPHINMTLSEITLESGITQKASFKVGASDKVLCQITKDKERQQSWAAEGAAVRVRGKIHLYRQPTNEGEFDEVLYYYGVRGYLFTLEDTRILSYTDRKGGIREALYRIRNSLSAGIDSLFAGRHGEAGKRCASALKAMLLGQSSLLDRDVREEFQAAGIIHVVCVSGLHISMFGMALFHLLRKTRLPVPVSGVLSVLVMILYGLMTGMQTSCFRALVMFGLNIAARLTGRTSDLITSLSLAGVMILVGQPLYLYHSGFLFSFAAVIAIGLAMPAADLWEKPFVIPLFTMPVQLGFYYSFPLYSVLLNLLVILLAPMMMAGGAVSTVLYMAAATVSGGGRLIRDFALYTARLTSEAAYLIFRFYELLCSVTNRLPFHSIKAGRPGLWVVIVYYGILITALTAGREKKGTTAKALIRASLVLAAVIILLRVRYVPPFSMYILDVGQGDGILIRSCDRGGTYTVMIDGGSSTRSKLGQYVEIPFIRYHGITRIDCCVVTHDDLDHCSAVLELMEQAGDPDGIEIGQIALPSVCEQARGETYKKILREADRKKIPVTFLYRGMELTSGGLGIRCLHPMKESAYQSANEYSAVLLVTYGRFSALLTGDLEGEGEAELIRYLGREGLETNVLKVAHHGSGTASTEQFLNKVSSHTALISCGRGNIYGHPAPETVERLKRAGMRLFDTRICGRISIVTDGEGKYSVHTFIDKSD